MSAHDEILQGLNRLIGENVNLIKERDALREEVERLKQAQRWIPVEERFPQAERAVLTLWKDSVRTVEWMFRNGEWTTGATITHWMPLPPLPQKEAQP
jgi:hypothetical protein